MIRSLCPQSLTFSADYCISGIDSRITHLRGGTAPDFGLTYFHTWRGEASDLREARRGVSQTIRDVYSTLRDNGIKDIKIKVSPIRLEQEDQSSLTAAN